MRVVATATSVVHDARAGGVARRHGGLRRVDWSCAVVAISMSRVVAVLLRRGGRAGGDGHVTFGGVATGCAYLGTLIREWRW